MHTTPTSGAKTSIDWLTGMSPEVIATMIASFGAIIAALYGIHRAAGGKTEVPPPGPVPANIVSHMMDEYRGRLIEIERGVLGTVNILQEIRRALEGTGHRQEKMVEELETMSRTMARMEGAQGISREAIATMKSHEEMQVHILTHIREEIKELNRLVKITDGDRGESGRTTRRR